MKKITSTFLVYLFVIQSAFALSLSGDDWKNPLRTKTWHPPLISDTLAGINATQELKNKTFDRTLNTLLNLNIVNADVSASAAIANSKLAPNTANRAIVSDGSGFLSSSSTSSTQIGYLSTLTSDAQSQINTKATGPSSSTDNAIARYDGVSGKIIQDSTSIIDDNGRFTSSFLDSSNLIPNGGVELSDTTMFTCGSGNTCSRTTTAGEFSSGLAALKVATSAATLNVSQSQATPSGIQKQGFMRIIYRIPSAVTDAQICTLVDAAEQTCVPSNKLVNNGLFQSIEVPLVFGSTSVGWKAKTTATNTQNFFFDGMVVGQGIGFQNLMLDNTYSATISAAGVVSNLNVPGWISGNCSIAATSIFTCPIRSGIATLPMNCTLTVSDTTSGLVFYDQSASATGSSFTYYTTDLSYAAAARKIRIICQKQGNDYANASANVYSQASADFGATPVTYTLTNAGNATVTGTVSKYGERAIFSGRITMGSSLPTGTITLNLPSGYVMDGSSIFKDASVTGVPNNTNQVGTAFALSATSINFYGPTAVSPWNATTPATWANGNYIDFTIESKIVGWSAAPAIVGSFAGVPATPGYEGKVDTFSFGFGGASATTVCSASPCTTYNKVGASATPAVTWSTSGQMTMTFNKTYQIINCTWGGGKGASGVAIAPYEAMSCSNCSSIPLLTVNTSTQAYVNSYGLVSCQGAY